MAKLDSFAQLFQCFLGRARITYGLHEESLLINLWVLSETIAEYNLCFLFFAVVQTLC